MKFGQVIEYNQENYSSLKTMQNMRKEDYFQTSFCFLRGSLRALSPPGETLGWTCILYYEKQFSPWVEFNFLFAC